MSQDIYNTHSYLHRYSTVFDHTHTHPFLSPLSLSLSSQVDSDDLPLNVSREMLQQHKLLKVIKKKLVRKALDMFKKMSKEDYQKFWKEYSTSVKLGIMEDPSNKTRLAKLLRYVCVCVCVCDEVSMSLR